jgi:hypothetical protein
MADGLLRAVAQLFFGGQSVVTVGMAREWLGSHADESTDAVFRRLADRVFPLMLVDKSPSTVDSLTVMRRTWERFPGARFLHLLRHPRSYCESIVKLIEEKKRVGPIPATHWLMKLAVAPPSTGSMDPGAGRPELLDPQEGWYMRNLLIRDFLRSVPADRQLRVRGEDVFADPDGVLGEIAGWLEVRTDGAAVEEMKHPERSPYARLGPPGARYGNDGHFLLDPVLRAGGGVRACLDGPLSWRMDGQGFWPEVRALAGEFGYE